MQRPAWKLLALVLLVAGQANATDDRVHVVRAGQTLSGIAHRYGVSVAELCKANGMKPSRLIRPKQKLVIPQSASDRRRAAARQPEENSHKAASGYQPSRPAKEYARADHRLGYVRIQSTVGAWEGYAVVADGRVSPKAKRALSRVLASWRTGARTEIDERLIVLLTRVSDHFGGRPLRVVSGFRPFRPGQFTKHSRHNAGQAVDFRVPGVPNEKVRDFCHTLKNVGVGYYPNSTFVHLDVREHPTRWTDYSGPGERPRYARGKLRVEKDGTSSKAPAAAPTAQPETAAAGKEPAPNPATVPTGSQKTQAKISEVLNESSKLGQIDPE